MSNTEVYFKTIVFSFLSDPLCVEVVQIEQNLQSKLQKTSVDMNSIRQLEIKNSYDIIWI